MRRPLRRSGRRENAPQRRRSRNDHGTAFRDCADGARARGVFAVRQRYCLRGGVDAGVHAGGGNGGGGTAAGTGDRIGVRQPPDRGAPAGR
nr:MAG TPA: hypothetical protein [Caudoviricetes sp.]